MRRAIASISLMLVLLAAPAGRASQSADPCAQAKRTNSWCQATGTGYVAGVAVPSKFVFHTLDVHGHPVEPSAMTCPVCRKAILENGYCAAHNMGFVGGRAYMSRMTYELARSTRLDPATLHCPVCLAHVKGIGWCDQDRLGIAGRFSWSDPAAFKDFEDAYGILKAALEKLPTCETCAAAMVADGYCHIHRVKFSQGRPTTLTSP
jgi:hypothetical protein